MADIMPYSFDAIREHSYEPSQQGATPGQCQGVYFTTSVEEYTDLAQMIINWFAGHDEVVIVDYGETDKQGDGYIIIEWDECEINDLFLAILRDDPRVIDYSTYTRDLEEIF